MAEDVSEYLDRTKTAMLPEPRAHVKQLEEVVHGAFNYAELERLGLSPADIVDFSVNGNPYGPSPRVAEAMTQTRFDHYPDREALALRRVLAEDLALPPDRILVGNGSMELMWLIALAYLDQHDVVCILKPTFGEYERAVKMMGASIRVCHAMTEPPFAADIKAVEQVLSDARPRLVFCCNPNNPTGDYIPVETIDSWASAYPETLFVVDEAYLTFAAEAQSMLTMPSQNVLVLRSMTKAYALAGIRLGYVVGHPQIVSVLRKVCPTWSVNALAQAAGVAALRDPEHLAQSLVGIAEAKQTLVRDLEQIGFKPLDSTTHFFLLPVGDAPACRRTLLQHGLLVRDCTSFGLPAYIRVSTRLIGENARLVSALAGVR